MTGCKFSAIVVATRICCGLLELPLVDTTTGPELAPGGTRAITKSSALITTDPSTSPKRTRGLFSSCARKPLPRMRTSPPGRAASLWGATTADDVLPFRQSCTSIVDGLEGAAFHLAARINLAVVAKTNPDRLGIYAQERGWHNIRLLSSRNNTFNRDYHGETPEGEQLPVLNMFSRDDDGIYYRWASALTFAPGGDTSSLDPIWSIWGALDMTPEGRGDGAGYPSLQYE